VLPNTKLTLFEVFKKVKIKVIFGGYQHAYVMLGGMVLSILSLTCFTRKNVTTGKKKKSSCQEISSHLNSGSRYDLWF